jgi:hypothetical protein
VLGVASRLDFGTESSIGVTTGTLSVFGSGFAKVGIKKLLVSDSRGTGA